MKKLILLILPILAIGMTSKNQIKKSGIYATKEAITNNSIDGFTFLSSTKNRLVLDYFDGYLYSQFFYYMTPYTTKSNLVLVKTVNSFTPGYIAYRNGNTNYHEANRLYCGYVHLTYNQLYVEPNIIGGPINLVASWPMSSSFQTTISSAYGSSLSNKNSLTEGISIGNCVISTIEKNNEVSMSLSYQKTVSTTSEDPILSYQHSPSKTTSSQWYFEISNYDVAGKVTYNLITYDLLEISNEIHINCLDYAFSLTSAFSFTTVYQPLGFLIWTKESARQSDSETYCCFTK